MGSDFLIATPTFWSGIARLVDLFGELDDYNYGPTSEIADSIAARVDWQTVGGDLATAMRDYRLQATEDQLALFEERDDHLRATG